MSTFGPAYDEQIDGTRIATQMELVCALMCDGQWRTLSDLAWLASAPESSVSAQLRHLRKPKFGGYLVEKRRRTASSGTWEYRLLRTEPQ